MECGGQLARDCISDRSQFRWKGKGNTKGKNKNKNMLSTERDTRDVNSVVENTGEPSYNVEYNGQEWIKFNYDTGAATTAVLVVLAEGLPLHKVDEFIVAPFPTVDVFGNKRKMEGQVTERHKTFASAIDISEHHDAFRSSSRNLVLSCLRREHHRLCQLHGSRRILPLYRTRRLHKYYLRRAGILGSAPVEPNQDVVMHAPKKTSSSLSSSGNAWQAQKPQSQKEGQKCRPQERLHELRRGTWETVRQQKPSQQSSSLATKTTMRPRSLKSSER